jgi:Ca-activated chloride channel homolog
MNSIVLKIFLSIVCSFGIGIQASGNLLVTAQTKEESKTDENQPPQGSKSSGEGFKIKTEVNLATADVTVIGTPASELRAEDFIVFDNDVAQKASYFSRDRLPIAIAILIDKSDSTKPYVPVLQVAGITALRRLKPEDQVALFAFDTSHELLSGLTEDRLRIADRIGQIKFGGGTNIYDPLFEAASYLKKNAPQRRRAIILISDNGHHVYGLHDEKQCHRELLETATALYNIRIPATFEDPGIRELAEETGGDVMGVDGMGSLKEALEAVIVQLRMQYTIGFNPSNPGKPGSFHKLKVQFANKECCPVCQLSVRGGYYAGVASQLPSKEKTGAKPQRTDPQTDELLVQRSIQIAGTSYLDLNEIPFEVSTKEQTDAKGQPQLQVDFKLNAEDVDLSQAEGSRVCKITAAIFSADEKGNGLGSSWLRIEKPLKEEDYRQVMKTGIAFSTQVPLKANSRILRIVVYDVRSDKLSAKLVNLHDTTEKKTCPIGSPDV